MKMKEVSQKTGLTKKTIRFYEAEGLLHPEKTWQNGREYRSYTEEDVAQLQKIASLRRARFSVDEVRRIQEDPAQIPEIFYAYRERLRKDRDDLQAILSIVDSIPCDGLTNEDALIEELKPVTYGLPLPAADLDPHFRYLDELEELSGLMKGAHFTEMEARQKQIAAVGAALYAGGSVQNSTGNSMAAYDRGFDLSNAQKIAAYNLMVNTKDE